MRALIVATSCNRLPSGYPRGLWAEEYAVPYMALRGAGVELVVASPAGGVVPIDEKSKPSDSDAKAWAPALLALHSTRPLPSVKDQAFELIFLPGGHGPLVDVHAVHNAGFAAWTVPYGDNGREPVALAEPDRLFPDLLALSNHVIGSRGTRHEVGSVRHGPLVDCSTTRLEPRMPPACRRPSRILSGLLP